MYMQTYINMILGREWKLLGGFKEQNGKFVKIEVDEMRRLMSHIRPETFPNYTMPARSKCVKRITNNIIQRGLRTTLVSNFFVAFSTPYWKFQ